MSRGKRTNDQDSDTERKCLATGEVQPKFGLIRFVVGPDNTVYPDLMNKLPGRGMYVSADKTALEHAIQKGMFARGAKQQVTIPQGFVADIEQKLARRVVDLISLARKSGTAVSGYEKVKDWLIKDYADVLIQSSDGSERGKSKLSTPQDGVFIGWLTSDELGMAFGKQTVIHCALATGGLTQRVVDEAQRLKGLRGFNGAKGRREGKDS